MVVNPVGKCHGKIIIMCGIDCSQQGCYSQSKPHKAIHGQDIHTYIYIYIHIHIYEYVRIEIFSYKKNSNKLGLTRFVYA